MPRLSAEKRKILEKLAARPDREIDLSDIPEIREIPSDYVIGKFYRPKKETVTIRLDADVLAESFRQRLSDAHQQLSPPADATKPCTLMAV